jgi:hypothetical protein
LADVVMDLHSEGQRFEPRPGHWLYWLRYFLVFHIIFRQIPSVYFILWQSHVHI